ncbi:leucine-rich repeat domain-containing protein [Flavobacterium artemisiae]|uniref:Leucine-rich repeat domain-containing protein n=1 Tax=Flavobacterium artemisiae TaxID=2126556 RepID=A0ABW4HA49_9FLAO
MINIFKIKADWIIVFVMVLLSAVSFAQADSKKANSFNKTKAINFLKERGLTGKQIDNALKFEDSVYQKRYSLMRKKQSELLESYTSRKKMTTSSSSFARTASVMLNQDEDVPVEERNALMDLYNATQNEGPWNNSSNWNTVAPVSTWWGVTVENNHVTSLSLQSNNLSGQIPSSFANLPNLRVLSLTNNQLTGGLTAIGVNHPYMEVLYLSNNNFIENALPNSFQDLQSLKVLSFSNAQLSSNLEVLGYLPNLEYLDLNSNKFKGTLSPILQNLTSLTFINMDENEIEDISVLGSLTLLKDVWFNNNKISIIPTSIGNLSSLESLGLSFNNLSGNVPQFLTGLENLSTLSLGYNKLNGTFPDLRFNHEGLYGQGLSVQGNNFRYIDFIDNINYYNNKGYYFFSFYPQLETDTRKTLSRQDGQSLELTMFEDNRYLPEDTYQWYKDDVKIKGATNRTYTIPIFDSNLHTGIYYCLSFNENFDPNSNVLNRAKISVNKNNCTEETGMITLNPNDKLILDKILNFSFSTTNTNLKYKWKLLDYENYLIDSQTGPVFTTIVNDTKSKLELEITNADGCKTTFTKELKFEKGTGINKLQYRDGYIQGNIFNMCLGDSTDLSFDRFNFERNLSYKWVLINSNDEVIESSTNLTYSPTLNSIGWNKVKLFITDDYGYTTIHSVSMYVTVCNSCTATNLKSEEIKGSFKNLVKNLLLRSLNGESDQQITGSSPSDLQQLKPYIINSIADKIYNYKTTRNDENEITSLEFAFSPNRAYDVYIASHQYGYYLYEGEEGEEPETTIDDEKIRVDISQYTDPNEYFQTCWLCECPSTVPESKIGCPEGSAVRYVNFCPVEIDESYCINEPINLVFETTSTNVNYNWYTIKEGTSQRLNEVTNTTGEYSYIPSVPGKYTVFAEAYESTECKFEFHKEIIVKSCEPEISCTKDNPNTNTIKSIFTTLANKLVNLPAATITNGYKCDELKALAFYIKDENPAIYNFVHDTQQGFIAFSFGNHSDYDVKIATQGNRIVEFNLDKYVSNEIMTILNTPESTTIESYVNHIDFCSGLYCVNHIAIVLDESGSISLTEATKIKKQLKRYIQQQADDNDKLQSNIYVSLTGMADSDNNGYTRTDNILPTRLTNTDPSVLKKFNNWIDNYRNRSGSGISASSDYWKTALDIALNSVIKPNVVMMITDGCETSNVEALRDQTMARFSNSKSTLFTNTDKPHLYVIGIANGFYVDSNTTTSSLNRNEDPNYVQTLTALTDESRVVPVLRTSLKYLLSFGQTEYPRDKIDDFRFDFYGYENFDSLGTLENAAFLSDNLKLSEFSCGLPTDKNYCSDCLSFQPEPNKEYLLSAWVKEETGIQLKTYENAVVNVVFFSNVDTNDIRYRIGSVSFAPKGDIIDGWQRITSKFLIPEETKTIGIELENKSDGIPVYFDDIRIHPLDGSIKTFVYDAETFKLMSELDENNYSTFYEYDNEGGLVRIKKETAKGIKTIQETRSGNFINNN